MCAFLSEWISEIMSYGSRYYAEEDDILISEEEDFWAEARLDCYHFEQDRLREERELDDEMSRMRGETTASTMSTGIPRRKASAGVRYWGCHSKKGRWTRKNKKGGSKRKTSTKDKMRNLDDRRRTNERRQGRK